MPRKRKRRTPEQMERDRRVKAARRAAMIAAAAAAAEAEAARQDAIDEWISPHSMRHPVVRPDGSTLRGALVQVVDGIPRRATGIPDDALGRAARNNAITTAHMAAARLFQADASEAAGGINAPAVDYARSGGGGGDGTGMHMMVGLQIAARGRLEGALAHMGALGPVVVRVVLDAVPVAALAVAMDMPRDAVLGRLVAGLTRLAGFYRAADEGTRRGQARIVGIGPERAEYSTVEGMTVDEGMAA